MFWVKTTQIRHWGFLPKHVPWVRLLGFFYLSKKIGCQSQLTKVGYPIVLGSFYSMLFAVIA